MRIQVLRLGLLYSMDQRSGNLLVCGGLHEDPDRQILDQIRKNDLPGNGQQGKVIGIAETLHRRGDLFDIIPRIYDQS